MLYLILLIFKFNYTVILYLIYSVIISMRPQHEEDWVEQDDQRRYRTDYLRYAAVGVAAFRIITGDYL